MNIANKVVFTYYTVPATLRHRMQAKYIYL